MEVRACSVCSGSSANAIYIEIDGKAVLIDVGCSLRNLCNFLGCIDKTLADIKAVFITHEHSDHIKGVPALSKKGIPIISNKETLNAIKDIYPETETSVFREMPTGFSAKNGDFTVTSFKTSHDSRESVGYVISTENGSVGVVTDLGVYDEKILEKIRDCRLLFIEANHDINMLWDGKYPYPLKRRISGKTGHLSNEQCAALLTELSSEKLEYAVLSHLSAENNTPEKAFCEVSSNSPKNIKFFVAPRYEKSEFIFLRGEKC